MFDATKNNSKYRDIQFQAIDLDSHDPLAEQYQIHRIPRVVIVSGNGTVLYNDSPPRQIESFQGLIDQFH